MLCGMWHLPGPGLEPMSPALAGGFLTPVPPGKPQDRLLRVAFPKTSEAPPPHHQVYLTSPVLQKHREKLRPRALMTGQVLAARSNPELAKAWGREGVRVGGGFKLAPNTGSVTI